MSSPDLSAVAQLRDALLHRHERIVFAESCTAGRVMATLSVLPGISQCLCGGFVVYRSDSKTQWLAVPHSVLDDPQLGPVSREASRLLCQAALAATPEAQWSVAVTGDVGPQAPAATDGLIFIAMLQRGHEDSTAETVIRLEAPVPSGSNDVAARIARLEEATERVLAWTVEQLASASSGE